MSEPIIIRGIEQRSVEWREMHTGLVTASRFSDLVTPGGKPSKGRDRYIAEIVAEAVLGYSLTDWDSIWAERGRELESIAKAAYEFDHDVTLEPVSFVYGDESRTWGCSPDALIGEDGGHELKCPGAVEHVRTIIGGEVPTKHLPQILGSLLVTQRDWWVFHSYCPGLPDFTRTVTRATFPEMYDLLERLVPEAARDVQFWVASLKGEATTPAAITEAACRAVES